jgi:RNA-directed DNA polymerase
MPSKRKQRLDREAKVKSRTASAHGIGESDRPIVPKNWANEGSQSRPKRDRHPEEPGEERGLAKGNAVQPFTADTQRSGKKVSQGLDGVREAAQRDRGLKFNNLLHHVSEEQLVASYRQLRREAAPGIDRMTWREYRKDHRERIKDLHNRVHRGSYRALPSRRTTIPKPDGSQRALGIAALEDKIVQRAVSEVLGQIYEQDFLGFSYGFRPARSPHQALDALWVALVEKPVNWVLDMDIKGFFDHIRHDWLLRFIDHRIADKRMRRLIVKWLRAGISDQGKWEPLKEGTPQGAVISPLLANIYLHYAFDLWAHQWRCKYAKGTVVIVRYADDIVMGFQSKAEALAFWKDVEDRLAKFGLELHPEKTRLIEFGRYAMDNRRKNGQGKPETFDFLGFTHICTINSRGRYTVRRKTISKRLRSKLKQIKAQLRSRYHEPVPEQGQWLRSVFVGYENYFAVPGNMSCLKSMRHHIGWIWGRCLRRRSQKGKKLTWAKFGKILSQWIPMPRCKHPWPNERFRRQHPRQEPYAVMPHVRICAGGAS